MQKLFLMAGRCWYHLQMASTPAFEQERLYDQPAVQAPGHLVRLSLGCRHRHGDAHLPGMFASPSLDRGAVGRTTLWIPALQDPISSQEVREQLFAFFHSYRHVTWLLQGQRIL